MMEKAPYLPPSRRKMSPTKSTCKSKRSRELTYSSSQHLPLEMQRLMNEVAARAVARLDDSTAVMGCLL